VIAEQIAKGSRSEELATKEFFRAELAALCAELHREVGLLTWKLAGMLLLQTVLIVTLTTLL
jgi:hypothetical protein